MAGGGKDQSKKQQFFKNILKRIIMSGKNSKSRNEILDSYYFIFVFLKKAKVSAGHPVRVCC